MIILYGVWQDPKCESTKSQHKDSSGSTRIHYVDPTRSITCVQEDPSGSTFGIHQDPNLGSTRIPLWHQKGPATLNPKDPWRLSTWINLDTPPGSTSIHQDPPFGSSNSHHLHPTGSTLLIIQYLPGSTNGIPLEAPMGLPRSDRTQHVDQPRHHIDQAGSTWVHQDPSHGSTRIHHTDPPSGATRIHHFDPPGSIMWNYKDPPGSITVSLEI